MSYILHISYSEVPNKRADWNKQADWHFFLKFINEQTGINEYAGFFRKFSTDFGINEQGGQIYFLNLISEQAKNLRVQKPN